MNINSKKFYCIERDDQYYIGYQVGNDLDESKAKSLKSKIRQVEYHNWCKDDLLIIYVENDVVKKMFSLADAKRILKLSEL
jgi:hypothetical protein